MNAILLAPTPITKANINVAIDAGTSPRTRLALALPPVRFRAAELTD